MMEGRAIVKRGKMTYWLSESSVVVGINDRQFVSYNIYNSPSRSNLAEFKKRILASKPNQYDNVIDQIDLARNCNLIGSGTQRPKWDEE